ncbi:hypothetical protein [Gracilimonas mengyeensis]|uniref:Uncharacterized protein n=1 Tax=Gracilimonas mengyeensis TaxID=1302730 RepID=A0A521BU15_9BACT|nr:hypothetical protein [Gracilimonas mengyeensis]SMO50646.1 hypothetical protein SAMN06265219_10392 [Gracilimonas mengyeensis]
MKEKHRCEFCEAVEGKPRPLGRFIVELEKVKTQKGKEIYVCQSCVVHNRDKLDLPGKGDEKGILKIMKRCKRVFTG